MFRVSSERYHLNDPRSEKSSKRYERQTYHISSAAPCSTTSDVPLVADASYLHRLFRTCHYTYQLSLLTNERKTLRPRREPLLLARRRPKEGEQQNDSCETRDRWSCQLKVQMCELREVCQRCCQGRTRRRHRCCEVRFELCSSRLSLRTSLIDGLEDRSSPGPSIS